MLLLLINLLDFKASKANKTKDLSHISSSLIMTRLALLQTVGHSQWSNDSWMFDKYLCLGEPLCAMCTLSRLRQNLWSVSSFVLPFSTSLKSWQTHRWERGSQDRGKPPPWNLNPPATPLNRYLPHSTIFELDSPVSPTWKKWLSYLRNFGSPTWKILDMQKRSDFPSWIFIF